MKSISIQNAVGYTQAVSTSRPEQEKKGGTGRRDNAILPLRMVLVLLGAFAAFLLLPVGIASGLGQLDLAVTPIAAGGEIQLTAAEGWSVESITPQEESFLQPALAQEAVTVSPYSLPVGETESFQITCVQGSETELVTCSFTRDSEEELSVRVYPENADLFNANYVFQYGL